MATATTTCQVCGAVTSEATARFCGRCGADLRVSGSPSSDPRAPDVPSAWSGSPGRRAGLGLVAGVAVVIVVALGSNGVGGTLDALGGSDAGRSEAAGDLDAADEVIGIGPDAPRAGSGDGAEPTQPSAVDPGPLRCAPDGCDAWQRPAPSGEVAGSAGVLYSLDGHRLTARSGPFATERWSVSLADLAPVTGDGDPIDGLGGRDEPALVRADPDGVVVVARQAIVRHDRDGVRRWQLSSDGWRVWDAGAVDGRHLITR